LIIPRSLGNFLHQHKSSGLIAKKGRKCYIEKEYHFSLLKNEFQKPKKLKESP
jgi:hypothetical protein